MALKQSLQRLAAGLVELLHTRIELLSVELQELAVAGAQALVRLALALLLVLFALGCAVAALTLSVPPEARVGLLAGLAVALLVLAGWLGWFAVQRVRQLGRPLAASLQELTRDEQALKTPEPPREPT